MNKTLKIILIILGSLALLLLLVTLLISPIAKSYVNSHGEDLIGRKVNIDHLKVNVYSGSVKIYDLTVYEDDATTSFLSFDTLDVSVKLRRLLAQEINVRHIAWVGLNVNVLQDGSRFNFSSIIDHFASDSTEAEEPDTTSSSWTFDINNIRFSHWRVFYADRQTGADWDLNDINLEIPGVYFNGNEATDAGLNLTLADGGELLTQIKYTIETNDFDISLSLKDLALSNVKAYLTDFANIGTLQGHLNADLRAQGNLDSFLKARITGSAAIRNADIKDTEGAEVVRCSNLAVKLNELVLDDNRYDIASIQIDDLASHFDMLHNTNNFSRLLDVRKSAPAPQEETSAAPADTLQAPAESKPMQLRIGQFRVNNAAFTYNDFTLPERFSFPVTRINASADNISLDGDNALNLYASLPHGGRAVIKWKGSIDDIKRHQDLTLNISNVVLTDLSPYCLAYLAQPLTNGTLSFTSHNIIRHSELDGQNKIDIYKPEVGKRRKDIDSAMHIPLKAALYVLKDKDDKVILDVPIKGNLDNPEFSYMKLVWKTLGNLIVKVATSPARGIADALGMGKDNMEFLPFDASQQDFTSEQYYVMDKISQVASMDTNIVIIMQQQIGASESDSTFRYADQRNQAVVKHFEELGVPARQLEVSTSSERPKQTGYKIDSRLRIDD